MGGVGGGNARSFVRLAWLKVGRSTWDWWWVWVCARACVGADHSFYRGCWRCWNSGIPGFETLLLPSGISGWILLMQMTSSNLHASSSCYHKIADLNAAMLLQQEKRKEGTGELVISSNKR